MRKLLSVLIALTLLGSFVQIIVIYFLPYLNMINYGGKFEQLVGIGILLVPVVGFILVYRFVTKIVSQLLNRKGNW